MQTISFLSRTVCSLSPDHAELEARSDLQAQVWFYTEASQQMAAKALLPGYKVRGLLTLFPGTQVASFQGLLFFNSIAHSKLSQRITEPFQAQVSLLKSKYRPSHQLDRDSSLRHPHHPAASPCKKDLNSALKGLCLLPLQLSSLPGRISEYKPCYRPGGGSPDRSILGAPPRLS